jgi:hypothetical protein
VEEIFQSYWSLIEMLSIWIPGRQVELGNALGARVVSFIQMLSISMNDLL